ncbi:TRAP transporter large permease subunit [Vibrio hangzhouensis]|uniref:TRAP transporter large permease n=1 Tax=Vibrio hangzhouensis TaxID=462991 RepID=UPI001C97B5F1|nr:TRAP transporter large permease subunit [Vibrio hangzhouensis]MBY6195714.1 TRAP transporter large permease subunit [Vibrio hangzhouensis]
MSETLYQPSPAPELPTWQKTAISLYQRLDSVMSVILMGLMGAMSVLIIYQVFTRYVLGSASGTSQEMLIYSMIWMAFLGSAVCFGKGMHLSLPLFYDKLAPKNQNVVTALNSLLVILLAIMMIVGGIDAVVKNASFTTPMMRVSMSVLQSILWISGAFIIVQQLGRLIELVGFNRQLVVSVAKAAALLTVIGVVYSTFQASETYEYLVDEHLEVFSTITLFAIFFLLLGLNLPIAVGLAYSGLIAMSLQIEADMLVMTSSEKLFSGLESFGFLALPFFILAGNLMNQGGIARRLIDLALLLGRRIPGALWQSNVVANMLFGCLSGSGIAASTAIGGVISPMAKEKGYDMSVSTAINAASAPTGMMIPPTGVFIIYSMITSGAASIAGLFLAGYIPGLMMGLSVMIAAYFYAKRLGYTSDVEPQPMSVMLEVIWKTVPSLTMIVVIIGGILTGVFTAIEAGGIAVLYSLLLSVAYKTLTWSSLAKTLRDSALTSSVILFLISCSGLMSWSMTFASIPDTIGELLVTVSENKIVILLLMNITLLIVGIFMDMAPALLIFTPIFYPVAISLGVDPIQFGVIIVYNLCMGLITPPVGTVLFVSCSVTGEKITSIIKPLLPIFLLQFIGLMLITYFPIFTMGLPRLFGIN